MRNMQPEDRDRLIEGLRKAEMTVPDPDAIASNAATSDLQPR
jgi:adenylate cyclase